MKFISMLKKYNIILNREQKFWGIVVFALSILGAVLETVGVSIILPFADVLLEPEEIFNSKSYEKIILMFDLQSPEALIVFLAISISCIYVIKNVYFVFLSWIRAKYIAKINRELAVSMMKSYMNKGYNYFTDTNTGTLLRGVQTDVNNTELLLFYFMKLIIDFATILFIVVYMFVVDWQLALGVGIMAGGCFGVVGVVFSRINLKAGMISRDNLGKSNQALLQAFQGIKEVLVLKKENFFVETYKKYFSKHLKGNLIRVVCSESPAYIIEGTCVATIFTIICVRVVVGGLSPSLLSVLAAFVVGAFRILPSIGKLTSEYSSMNYYYPGFVALYENISSGEVDSLVENKPVKSKICERELVFNNTINIEDVVFSYSESGIILNHLNLVIEKGESIAFIGPSGSGKTTLSDIILGLLYPVDGRILVDGRNIFDSPCAWSKMIGYVSQTLYLADDTIRFNVAFGVNEGEIDDERVWYCLRKAQIADYVEAMDQGIYTIVGDRGVKISGGQRQRIAIARALYHDPQILVLDEATSALDNDTEKAVMESIEALKGEITLIIIAHRLSTVKKCDRIYEINHGIAVEKNKESMDFV